MTEKHKKELVKYDRDVAKAIKKFPNLWSSEHLVRAREMAIEMILSGEKILKF